MIFPRLELIDDPLGRGATMNMAIDEALLESLRETPVLRVYRWAGPAVSFGYFEQFAAIRAAFPGHDLVRRWTGGGVVEHGADFTYSVLAPHGSRLAGERPAESYRQVHQALALAQPGAEIAEADAPKVSQACFENPVRHDLLLGGRKVAGAAQRRTRRGLLHQGSVFLPLIARVVAEGMAAEVVSRVLSTDELGRAGELVESRYGTRAWTERVR